MKYYSFEKMSTSVGRRIQYCWVWFPRKRW